MRRSLQNLRVTVVFTPAHFDQLGLEGARVGNDVQLQLIQLEVDDHALGIKASRWIFGFFPAALQPLQNRHPPLQPLANVVHTSSSTSTLLWKGFSFNPSSLYDAQLIAWFHHLHYGES